MGHRRKPSCAVSYHEHRHPPDEGAAIRHEQPQPNFANRTTGLQAVWLNRDHRCWPGNLARPDAVIDELGQLLRCVPKWLGLPGRRTPAAAEIPAAETEPPQVSGQLVAQIQ
jgi:hypothetical protein